MAPQRWSSHLRIQGFAPLPGITGHPAAPRRAQTAIKTHCYRTVAISNSSGWFGSKNLRYSIVVEVDGGELKLHTAASKIQAQVRMLNARKTYLSQPRRVVTSGYADIFTFVDSAEEQRHESAISAFPALETRNHTPQSLQKYISTVSEISSPCV